MYHNLYIRRCTKNDNIAFIHWPFDTEKRVNLFFHETISRYKFNIHKLLCNKNSFRICF